MNQIQHVRTPTGVLSIIRPTAEKLLQEGVISGELDGELHAGDAATVKAAIMASAVCDFCSSPGASHYYDVPDFGITTNPRGGTNYGLMVGSSEGGWMACDACHDLIGRNRRKDLVDRAIASHAFPKFSHHAIAELYAKFWQGMDERAEAVDIGQVALEFVEDRLQAAESTPQYGDRAKRVATITRTMKLTEAEINQLIAGDISRDAVQKLLNWRKSLDPARRTELHRLLHFFDPPIKPATGAVPHWQLALDMKFAAIRYLDIVKNHPDVELQGYNQDRKLLRTAQAYSFNEETVSAIFMAANSIPRESPLSSIETPTGSGWFWFSHALDVQSSPASEKTSALLWAWQRGERLAQMAIPAEYLEDSQDIEIEEVGIMRVRLSENVTQAPMLKSHQVDALGRALRAKGVTQAQLDSWTSEIEGPPTLMLSTYVFDDKKMDQHRKNRPQSPSPIPATRWYWNIDETFDEMITRNAESWEERYGEGQKYADLPYKLEKEATIHCIERLSLFMLMACVWFQQTVEKPAVLQKEQGPMERQERKRLQKEHNLKEIPTVQVIALRKTARAIGESKTAAGAEHQRREYHYRWIVQGHNRLQPCGPGRKDKKLIWIDAYPKGPEGKPLRTREKVYAVVR